MWGGGRGCTDHSPGDTGKALLCGVLQGWRARAPGDRQPVGAPGWLRRCGGTRHSWRHPTGTSWLKLSRQLWAAVGRAGRKARLWRRIPPPPWLGLASGRAAAQPRRQPLRAPLGGRPRRLHPSEPRRGAGATPLPARTCWGGGGRVGGGGGGRGGSWRGCAASAGSSGRSLPFFPSSLPRLPERPEAAPAACAARSAGRRRRRRPELPALGAKQITVQSTGRLSEGNTHVPQAGYLETLFSPVLPGSLSSLRSLLCPLHLSSPLPRALPLPSATLFPFSLPQPSPPVGRPWVPPD